MPKNIKTPDTADGFEILGLRVSYPPPEQKEPLGRSFEIYTALKPCRIVSNSFSRPPEDMRNAKLE